MFFSLSNLCKTMEHILGDGDKGVTSICDTGIASDTFQNLKICIPQSSTFSDIFLILVCEITAFLAHLSRRLMGELIVYQSLRPSVVRPSVPLSVRLSTFSNIFSSETTGPNKLKFHMETP